MRRMARWFGYRTKALLVLCIALACGSGANAGDEDIERFRSIYNAELESIGKKYDAADEQRLQEYGAQLKLAARQLPPDRRDEIAALEAERLRFEKEKIVPSEFKSDDVQFVVEMRRKYHETRKINEVDKAREIIRLAEMYIGRLTQTVRERLDRKQSAAARDAQAEIEEVRASAAVTSSQFVLLVAERNRIEAELASRIPCPKCQGEKTVDVVCEKCKGRGRCSECGGLGKKPSSLIKPKYPPEKGIGGYESHLVGCVHCAGTGACRFCKGTRKIKETCPVCNGLGYTHKNQEKKP